MIRARVFVGLAIALLVAGSLFAEATDAPENSKDKAVKHVTELQELTARVLGHAEAKFAKAESTKSTVEDQKKKAESAEAAVKTAAGTITVKERKEEANVIVEKAKTELTNCHQLHQAAKAKADQVSGSLNGFVTRAKALVESAKIPITPSETPPNDYSKVIQGATTVKGQTTTLSGEINESKLLSDADDEMSQLRDSAKKIGVFKYQAESIAIVSQIETALKTAETDIQNIPQKKGEIDTIVTEMNTKCKIPPDKSKSPLSSLCTTANSQLQTATTKLKEAQQCNTVMQGQKTQLDATLATLKDTTLEDQAKDEAGNVKGHEGFIDGELQKIKAALLAADNALRSAKDVQQQIQGELSKHKSQSGTKLNEGNPQDNVRTEEATKPIQNGEAIKPAITETDQTVLGTSKDTIDKTSEKTIDAKVDKTKETKSTQLAHNEKPNPKDDKLELLNNDKLSNITKDITNNPLIGGEVPTRNAANDSAVTVFIPLLVILVIYAVLH